MRESRFKMKEIKAKLFYDTKIWMCSMAPCLGCFRVI